LSEILEDLTEDFVHVTCGQRGMCLQMLTTVSFFKDYWWFAMPCFWSKCPKHYRK